MNDPNLNYVPGQTGVSYLPNFTPTNVPEVPSFTEFLLRDQTLDLSTLTPPEIKKHEEEKKKVLCEIAERQMQKGVKDYFDQLPNIDATVFFGQLIEYDYLVSQNPSVWDKKLYEKDGLVVNANHGYILNIESKSSLSILSCKKGCNQLEETVRQFVNQFGPHIENDWRVIRVLHGTSKDPNVFICSNCDPYVIDTSQDDFITKLKAIIDENRPINNNWIQDYRKIVKDLIPPRVKLPDEIIDAIMKNLDDSGSANNILYWTKEQYEVARFCLNRLREIFISSYSTGKTTLMVHCALELLKRGEKVLFVIFHPNDRKTSTKSFLEIVLSKIFQNYLNSGQMELKSTKLYNDWNWLRGYHDWNVFIDDLILSKSPEDGIPTNILDIQNFHSWIDKNKHLWITISRHMDAKFIHQVKNLLTMFKFIDLYFPLRNAKRTIEFACSSANTASNNKMVPLKKSQNANSSRESYIYFDYQIPDNLIDSPPPIILEEGEIEHAIKEALKNIPPGKTAQVILPHYLGINDPPIAQWFNDVGRPKPLISNEYHFKNMDNQTDIENWILHPDQRQQDMITDDGAIIYGAEFDVGIILKKTTAEVDLNSVLRVRIQLIVANYEETDLSDQFALHNAILVGNLTDVETIFKGEDEIEYKDPSGRTPYDCALGNNQQSIVDYFTKRAENHLSCYDDVKRIQILVDFGIEINTEIIDRFVYCLALFPIKKNTKFSFLYLGKPRLLKKS